MKKENFTEELRKLLGGVTKVTKTTSDESGKVIEVETTVTKLPFSQIIPRIIAKLFIGLMILSALMSIFMNIYLAYALQPKYSYFRPGSLIISMGFLMFFMLLYSKIGDD
jgi:hypothetical protein